MDLQAPSDYPPLRAPHALLDILSAIPTEVCLWSLGEPGQDDVTETTCSERMDVMLNLRQV